jgi:hypothetical protein
MGVMKTLATAMYNPENTLEDSHLDETRCQAWHDCIDGVNNSELYAPDHREAYKLGRKQCLSELIEVMGP